MRQFKTIVAVVAGLFAFTSVNAGELSVTGSMQATYQSEGTNVTGNPLGMNTDLTFSGSTDTDFGTATWSMATDGTFLSESAADHTMKLATSLGTIGIGNSGDAANAVDDITPSAFEEANGSGSGTYSTDFGSGMDGSMSLSYGNGDIMGTGISVAYNYYPKLDGTTNNEKGASGTASQSAKSAQSVNVGIPLSGLPVIGDSPVGGAKITLGYEESGTTVTQANGKEGVGPMKVGYQKKAYRAVATAATEAGETFFKDDILGIAYAVNDDFAISYNIIESTQHIGTGGTNVEQETKAINVAYTVGGLTLGFQDAKTTNAGYTLSTDDDTRTVSVKTAF